MMHDEPESKELEVFGTEAVKEILPYDQPAYRRTIRTREIAFTCERCGRTVTQQRYPGPVPRYCTDYCKMAAQREGTRERMRRLRERAKGDGE